jgi:hypothetical protein
MDKKQIKQALQQIAAERISSQTDLWPAIQKQLSPQARPVEWQWLSRLSTAMVVMLLLIFFLTWLNSLAQLPQTETTTAVPLLVSGPPETSIELTFPMAPATLPRYQVLPILPPETQAEVVAWAEDFGFTNPRPFRDPRSPEQLLVLDDDNDSRLTFPLPANDYLGVSYLRSDWLELPPGETIALAEGTAVATSFLAQHSQLPERYHLRNVLLPYFSSYGYPVRTIRVAPDLDGYPLLGEAYRAELAAVVMIDAAGEVFAASFNQADFVALDMVAIRPAEDVVEDFVNGRITPLHTDQMPPVGEMTTVKQYAPPLPQHEIGQSITVLETDDTHFLLAQDGGEHQVVLRTAVGAKYELLTPDLVQIADTVGNAHLQVSGTIVGQTAPDTWQLAITSWETFPQQLFLSGCALGSVEIEADGSAWITAEAVLGRLEVNGRYHIPNLPPEINGGDRIEVCSERMLTLEETIPWSGIIAPPRTWHYDGQPAEVEALAQSASPYELGHTVALTGLLEATIYQEDENERLAVSLWADLAGATTSHLYSLVGDEALLAALASEHLHHYVQITGTIVLADDTPWGDQAIEVEAFAQPWPEQQVGVYVGRLSQERSDTSVLTLFTDEGSGQSYVLPENGPRFEGSLLDATQVWVAGIVHPTHQINGRPVLRLIQWFPAQPGETLAPESYTLTSEPRLVQSERLPESLEREDLILDQVELAYSFAPPDKPDIAEPVWVVYGHYRDTQELFVAYLDAVVR